MKEKGMKKKGKNKAGTGSFFFLPSSFFFLLIKRLHDWIHVSFEDFLYVAPLFADAMVGHRPSRPDYMDGVRVTENALIIGSRLPSSNLSML